MSKWGHNPKNIVKWFVWLTKFLVWSLFLLFSERYLSKPHYCSLPNNVQTSELRKRPCLTSDPLLTMTVDMLWILESDSLFSVSVRYFVLQRKNDKEISHQTSSDPTVHRDKGRTKLSSLTSVSWASLTTYRIISGSKTTAAQTWLDWHALTVWHLGLVYVRY